MKKTLLLLLFPTMLFSQRASIIYGHGISEKGSMIGTVGFSFLMDNPLSDSYNFRIDAVVKSDGLDLGVENRFGVCTRRLYPFAYFNLSVRSNMGLGLMYRVPVYDNFLELGGSVSTGGRYNIGGAVILKF